MLYFLLLSITTKAQPIDTPYLKQPNLHKFEGTWEYKDSSVTFKIVLKVEKILLKLQNPDYMDFINGNHLFIKNKFILQNSIGKRKTISSGGFPDLKDSAKIEFLFYDLRTATDSVGCAAHWNCCPTVMPNGVSEELNKPYL